jgi:hypothetical protein
MFETFSQSVFPAPSVEVVLSVCSLGFTAYFWLVKARREQPCLRVFQLQNFRAAVRGAGQGNEGNRLCISQVGAGGVLIANDSTRQNSIVRFDCFLYLEKQVIAGTWGYIDEDKPPWNIGPEMTIALSPACFFPVENDFQVPDDVRFRMEFITVSGKRFGHEFSLEAPV